MKITVQNGNIGEIASDALITTVNSSGLWFGAIDGIIQRYTTNNPHSVLASKLQHMSDSSAISVLAEGSAFKHVVFVIDDLEHDLWVPIYNALDVSEFTKHKVVTIPTVRHGVMLGIREKNDDEYVMQFVKGIREWIQDNDNPYLKEIKIIVYNNQNMLTKMIEAFK